LSDGGGDKDMSNVATSMATKFEFSDEEAAHVAIDTAHIAMDTDVGTKIGGLVAKRTSTTLRSVICTIL
jgi:hypothetical protein